MLNGNIKALTKRLLRKIGLNVRYLRTPGVDLHSDLKFIIKKESPVFIDVGANTGQTTCAPKQLFPSSRIIAFEPGSVAYKSLQKAVLPLSNVVTHNIALGSKCGTLQFTENSHSDMSSFLVLGNDGWGTEQAQRPAPVKTLDSFAVENAIKEINLLKIDTQGYGLEVLKGSSELLTSGAIKVVLSEFIFGDLYKGLPPFHEIEKFMFDRDYVLYGIYNFNYLEAQPAWADLLYFHKSVIPRRAS